MGGAQNLRAYPMPPADAPLIPALIDLLGEILARSCNARKLGQKSAQ